MAKVKISRGLQANYNAIPVKDGDTIYVCTDSGNIYVGELPVFEPNAYIDASLEGKIITFTTHGADGTNGTDTLDLSVFQTASEVAQAIAAAISSIPDYTIEKLASAETGYSSSYVLKRGGTQVGATINIPKDMVVSNGEVKTVTTANVPYQGAVVGDKYIDLTIANTSQNHIYIPVKDLVDVYVASNGIHITQSNEISVKIDTNHSNGLGVGGDGVSLYVVTPSVNGVGGTNGAMLATDKEKLDGIAAGAEANVIETVKVSGTALTVTDKSVNIETETAYDPATNKIATMSDVESATPNVGHLKTNNTTAQTPSASESFTGDISLHKVSKTGSYKDLNDKPDDDFVKVFPLQGFYNNNSDWNLYLPGSFSNHHYIRITIPDSSLNKWTMLYFELSIMQKYGNGLCGKLYFFAMHDSTTGNWGRLRGTIAGNLTTEIKLYASDRKYLYIGGIYGYGSLSIDKLLCGDAIRLVDLTGITLDTVTSLPETYQTGTIYGAGASLTLDSNGLRLLDSMGDALTTIPNSTAANTFLGALPQWTADPSDDVYLIRRDTGGSLSFGQVKFSTVWNYIKSKIASILGIGGSNGVPTAPTAAAGTNTTQIATTAFVQSATNGMAIDTNVVHKTGDETIAGVKTFTDNVVLEDAPTQGTHATNKAYVDSADNSVFLNGATAGYKIHPYSLCAFATWNGGTWMAMASFTDIGGTGTKNPLPELRFPIGCKIYYHPASTEVGAVTSFYHKQFYTSYKNVDARYSAITGQNVSLGNSNLTSVYLHVDINGHCWFPYFREGSTDELIISPNDFKAGNFYIYLGKKSVLDLNGYEFQLEDNNPLYYYDGYDLLDWATYVSADSSGQAIQPIIQDLDGKMDLVAGATAGNIAVFDSNGQVDDTGVAPSDFATAAQGVLAENAVRAVSVGTTTTGPAGSNANVENTGTTTNPVLSFTIPRGSDGYNPFKGWFANDTQLTTEYPNPRNGDYAYVQLANGVYVYQAYNGAWRGTSTMFNPANNQEFATGEVLSQVRIINNLTTGGVGNVLSAEQGIAITNLINALSSSIAVQLAQRPIFEKRTEEEIRNMIANQTYIKDVLYYAVEED